jgi:hypothetical protein
MAADDRGSGVHYPDGISGGTHPGALVDCRIPRCIVRRIEAKSQQAAEAALDQLAATVREEQARHDAEVRAAAIREAADLIDNDDDCGCGGCDTCQPRALAAMLRAVADTIAPTSTPEPTP